MPDGPGRLARWENTMKRLSLGMAVLALTLAAPALAHEGSAKAVASREQFHDAMRKLWEDHVTYTAFFYTAVIHGGDDAGQVAARLLRNQDDIGNAVKPFYGEAAGNELAALLRDHILVAADLVKAAKGGNAAAQEQATRRWDANADEIAAFLSSANPNWPLQALKDALRGHLAMTTAAVVAKLHGDTAAAIAAYDKGHEHMLMVADVLSAGIVKQFPERFGLRPGAAPVAREAHGEPGTSN